MYLDHHLGTSAGSAVAVAALGRGQVQNLGQKVHLNVNTASRFVIPSLLSDQQTTNEAGICVSRMR